MKTDNSCRVISLRSVCHFLKKHDKYLILTHISPDGDTLGSAFALAYGLKSLGKSVFVKCADKIPEKFSFFTKAEELSEFTPETVIAVDVADVNLLGDLKNEYAGRIDLTIDHHISNTHYAKNLYLDSTASATAESIYEILKALKISITDVMAKAVYTGITTDTGSFKYTNVTAKTHRIAAELYSYNINAADIAHRMFDTKSRNCIELERMVLDTAKYYFDGRCLVLTVTSEMQEKSGCDETDLEGIAVISRSVEGVDIGVSIKQKASDLYKISVRTYPPIDASKICQKLGGGGHMNAAGCSVNGTLDEVKKQILSAISEVLEDK